MDDTDKFSKMAAELYEKAGAEESSCTKSDLEIAAQIYLVLAQRLDAVAVADNDAKGLQQQIAKHFANGTFAHAALPTAITVRDPEEGPGTAPQPQTGRPA